MTFEEWLGKENKIGIDTMNRKYRHKNESLDEWLDRVSAGDQELRKLIFEKKILIGGRTLSNRGTDDSASLFNCFVAGTEVLTINGYKPIEEIKVGEYVLTHDGTYQLVNSIMSRDYSGSAICFCDPRISKNIICTPNHKFLTQHGWVEASEIYNANKYQSSGNYKLYNVTHYIECDDVVVDLNALLQDKLDLEFDENKVWINCPKHYTAKINRYIKIDKDLKYVFGRYLGDGSVSDYAHYKNYIFQIVFNANTEYDEYILCKKIIEDHFGIECCDNSNKKQNTLVLKVNSRIVGAFFEMTCGKKENKHFPVEYKNDINIAIGLLDSDCYINDSNGIRIWLKSDILMNDLWLCLKNNNVIVPKYRKDTNNGYSVNKLELSQGAGRQLIPLMHKKQRKCFSNCNQFYDYNDSGIFMNVWDIKQIEINEPVYNISVENNHDYIVHGFSVHNCYSRGYIEDDYKDIMQAAVDIGLTFKSQGGQGLSLSKLRPKGAPIGKEYTSDGIVPFMKIYNEVTAGTSQGGSRKGALMISIDARHKEALTFIHIKSQEGLIEKANLSLEIDDEFMEAVLAYYETGEKIVLHEKRNYSGHIVEYDVTPIEVFEALVDNCYDWADPAALFVNRFRNYNLMQYDNDYQIETSNPCKQNCKA